MQGVRGWGGKHAVGVLVCVLWRADLMVVLDTFSLHRHHCIFCQTLLHPADMVVFPYVFFFIVSPYFPRSPSFYASLHLFPSCVCSPMEPLLFSHIVLPLLQQVASASHLS